jgi:phage gp36-like protein
MLLVDITLYHLHSRISPKEVPIVRLDRYNSAIKYLQKIASGELNPMLPLAPANNSERDESVIKFGDKGKFSVRNSRYF